MKVLIALALITHRPRLKANYENLHGQVWTCCNHPCNITGTYEDIVDHQAQLIEAVLGESPVR